MFQQLKDTVTNFVSFNESEWEELISYFTVVKVKRKTQLVKLNKTATEIYFINKGAVRIYILFDVEEINVDFAFENSFITSLSSFLLQTPGNQVVEAMEDSELLVLKQTDYEKLNRDMLKFNVLSRIIIEQATLTNEEQRFSLTVNTPKDRFLKAKEKRPVLFTRIPEQYLASYLDIPLLMLSKMIENR